MQYSRQVTFLLLLIAAVAIGLYATFFPIIKPFPELTGLYKVGVVTLYTEDVSRKETLAEIEGDQGYWQLTLHVWYPANINNVGKPTEYLRGKMPFLRQAFGMQYPTLAPFVNCLLKDMHTHACRDAEVLHERQKYPVVIFSHGLLGMPSDAHVVTLEELASHGFIVVAIDHTYLNLATINAQGALISSAALSTQFQSMSSKQQMQFQSMAIEVYKADIRHILDVLEWYNNDANSTFYHKLDLEHVGVMGHSAGGTAAIEVSRTEPRIKACVDLDGWYDHVIGWEPMKVPTLLLFGSISREVSEPTKEYLERKQLTREQYYEREQCIEEHMQHICDGKDCTMQIVEKASHGDFSDEVLFKWPLRRWNARESYGLIREINGAIIAFLRKYLQTY